MDFKRGPIEGVVVTPFRKFIDERGWLAEIFRHDDLPPWFRPEMSYVSLTNPGVLRGPHEHVDQADLFCWFGPGDFDLLTFPGRVNDATMTPRMAAMMTLRTIQRNRTRMVTKMIVVTSILRSSGSVSSASVGLVRRSMRRRSGATGTGSAI